MDNHDDNYNKTISLQGIPILRVISICAAAVLGTQSRGWPVTWSFWSLGRAEASCTSSFSHFPSQASFLHMWDSDLVLGIIGSSCHPVHDPCFTSEMPCVLFVLFSLVLGPWCHHWTWVENTLHWGHCFWVYHGCVPKHSAKEMPTESNTGAEPLGSESRNVPTQGKSDPSPCWEVQTAWGGPLSAPGVLPCSIGSCLLRTWSTPGLVWGHSCSWA